jgi:hypothetical protein
VTTTSDPTLDRRRVSRRRFGLALLLGGAAALTCAVVLLVVAETTSTAPDVALMVRLWVVGGGVGIAGVAAVALGMVLRLSSPRSPV